MPTEVVQPVAEQFVADNLGEQIGVGVPWHVVSSLGSAWVVPLMLTSPGFGIVGTVGVLIIDKELGTISAWTPLDEITTTAAHLAQQYSAKRQAAWERVQVKAPMAHP
jgi:hypothetical protein